MKKLLFTAAAVMVMLSACRTPYVDEPVIPGEQSGNRSGGSPGNVTATHGGKRSIELRWDEISGAVRYYIFKADSPLTVFVQCAETTETRFNFSVPAGSTVYYRVSAVMSNGQESARSYYVMGSSLAQPVITDITDITESSAAVTWYMENVSNATYKAGLRYTVYCFDKANGTEIAQLPIDGSKITENKASFSNLFAGKEYTWQVEAYLVNDQSNSEKSEIMDKETARRMRPGAAENLSASRGISTNTVELSFELPEMVNIALGADQYKLCGLYFVIYKRLYSEAGNQEYLKACPYFGAELEDDINDARGSASAVKFSGIYEIGKTVTWIDSSVVRGVEYEYMVQAYVDGITRTITSDESKASAVGWALASGTLAIGKPNYTENAEGSLYVAAEVPLDFKFNPMGEEYRYSVEETVNPLEDQDHLDLQERLDPDAPFTRKSDYLNYEQMKAYTARMDLTRKSMPSSPGRGLYSYKVVISLPGGGDIDTLSAIGDVQISEDVTPIVVEGFTVEDGYTDKFRIAWDSSDNRKYFLFESADGINWPATPKEIYNPNPTNDEDLSVARRIEPLSGYEPGQTVYFALQPVRVIYSDDITPVATDKKGQRVYLNTAAQTLGVPKSQPVTERSYSTVTAVWEGAQKADTYRIKYRYAGNTNWTTAATVATSELSPDANNQFKKSFKPAGFNDVTRAGIELQITVEALNEGLRALVGGNEIFTTSTENVRTRLVGPAELAPDASRAADATKIELTWNSIAGADGYYIFRRQFDINNACEEGVEAIVYYVRALQEGAAAISPIGKNLRLESGAKADASFVKASAKLASGRYHLTDEYLDDRPEFDGDWNGAYGGHIAAYRNQQNELTWGVPYRYYIIPVINQGGQPESLSAIEFIYGKDVLTQKNTTITSYSIRENAETITYSSGAASLEKTGFTIGFGMEVTASKGTKSETGRVDVSWTKPAHLTGSDLRYVLYRRQNGRTDASPWTRVTSDGITNTSYTDQPQRRGVAFDYAVGIYREGGVIGEELPPTSPRYIRIAKEIYLDDRDRPKLVGYTLASVEMKQVSRSPRDEQNNELKDSQGNFAEKVEWYAGGIDGADNYTDSSKTVYNHNWGIDGYEVYVMNRNIDGGWHKIADLFGSLNINSDQYVLVSNVQGGATLEGGLLKVMRDYKHYYKVRSYVINEQYEKILCPDPSYTYTHTYNTGTGTFGGVETNYIKWGARQVSATEFFTIAAIHVADGIQQGTSSWAGSLSAGNPVNANGTGTGGSVAPSHSIRWGTAAPIRYDWRFNFSNYKTDLQLRTGDWNVFLTINGQIWAFAGDYQYPTDWGDEGDITVTGPADTPGLYTGKMSFGQKDNSNLTWGGGVITVRYPDPNAARQVISYRGEWSPMQYYNQGDQRYQQDTWK